MPDAALLDLSGNAEVVLGINSTPTKMRLGTGVLAADIGKAPGDAGSSLITVAKVANTFQWRSTVVMTGRARTFKTTAASGSPIVGCYLGNAYTAAAFLPGKATTTLRLYGAVSDTVINLPAGVLSARCGVPVNGASAILSLVRNPQRKTLHVIAKAGAAEIFSSPALDTKLSQAGMLLGVVPRGAGEHPTAMVLASRGVAQELYVRSKTNRWERVLVPGVAAGSKLTAFAGVRVGSTTFIVVQITTAAKVTSYKTVRVPANLL